MSKFNRELNNQVTLLMITDGTAKWHYTALKSVKTSDGSVRPIKSYSRLMNGYSSKHKGDFYCYNCGNSYRTDRALAKHVLLCEKHDYCHVITPEKDLIGNEIIKLLYL